MESGKSNQRIISLFLSLLAHDKITLDDWHHIAGNQPSRSMRAFQLDIQTLNNALADHNSGYKICYRDNHYELLGQDNVNGLTYATAIAQVLLASRAFNTEHIDKLLDFLTTNFTAPTLQSFDAGIKPARGSYIPILGAHENIFELIKATTEAIAQHQVITFHYTPGYATKSKAYIGQPVAIYFETTYFYVALRIKSEDVTKLFRLDRMQSIDYQAKGIALIDDDFSLREHREEVMLLKMGPRLEIQFDSTLPIDLVKDDFPSARISKQPSQMVNSEGKSVPAHRFTATTYERGALIWLLGQGRNVKVVSPLSLVATMRDEAQAIADMYKDQ